MPLYNFECIKCGYKRTKICAYKLNLTIICEKCGNEIAHNPCKGLNPDVKVTLDKYRNKSVLRNINKIMRDRSWNYQKNYELGSIIERHGLKNSSVKEFLNLDGTVKFDRKAK